MKVTKMIKSFDFPSRFYRVFKRRHQLRMVALEIFDILNQSILLAFDVEDRADEILVCF